MALYIPRTRKYRAKGGGISFRPSTPSDDRSRTGPGINWGSGGSSVQVNNQGVTYPRSGGFSELEFEEIAPMVIPRILVPRVDPLERTGEVGDFNREQFETNRGIARRNALDLIQLEFEGLQNYNRQARGLAQEGIKEENAFNRRMLSDADRYNMEMYSAANEFNRSELPFSNEFNRYEISAANTFNQDERLAQLEQAMPGAYDTIMGGIERGSQLAEGRFVSDAEDRAYEVAARNAAADSSTVRGFGDDSVFGRRTSDLLSAEKRLELSQVGDQTVNRYLSMGANLAFDQPIKQNPVLDQPLTFEPTRQTPLQAQTSMDVRGAPSQPASVLATQQEQLLLPLTTIQPGQAIGFDIGQNQFQAGLDQRTNEFNSSMDYAAQQYNSATGLQVQLEQLYAELFDAQQAASAANVGRDTEIANNRFNAGISSGQNSAAWQAAGSIGGAAIQGLLSEGENGRPAYQDIYDAITGTDSGSPGHNTTPQSYGGEGQLDSDLDFTPGSEASGDSGSLGGFSFDNYGGQDFSSDYGSGYELDSNLDYGAYSSTDYALMAQSFSDPSKRPLVLGGAAAKATAPGSPAGGNSGMVAQTRYGMDVAQLATNAYAYYDNYDQMNNQQRAEGAAQLGTAAATLAGVVGPAAMPAVGTIISGVNMAQGWDNMNDAQRGAAATNFAGNATMLATAMMGLGPWGLAAGLVMIAMSRYMGDWFGSNKSPDQLRRDGLRQYSADIGLIQKGESGYNDTITLANGEKYNIGADGRHRLQNYGINVDGKQERYTFDIDWSDPRAQQSVAMLNPVSLMLYGQDHQRMMGHLWNAATSNNNTLSGTAANIRHYAETVGIDYKTGTKLLDQYKARGVLSDHEYAVYMNDWNELMLGDGVYKEVTI